MKPGLKRSWQSTKPQKVCAGAILSLAPCLVEASQTRRAPVHAPFQGAKHMTISSALFYAQITLNRPCQTSGDLLRLTALMITIARSTRLKGNPCFLV